MFGLSFCEIVILGVIALVVVGPRRLPSMLRTAGQIIGKVRRMAMDIRAESGIDEILDAEGIRSEIDNFRRLATGEIVPDETPRRIVPDRDREYPLVGADAYGALSEDVVPYVPSPAAEATAATAAAAGTVPRDPSAPFAEGDKVPSEVPSRVAHDSEPSLPTAGLESTGADVKH